MEQLMNDIRFTMFSLWYERPSGRHCGWIMKSSITQHPLQENRTANPSLDPNYGILQFLLKRNYTR